MRIIGLGLLALWSRPVGATPSSDLVSAAEMGDVFPLKGEVARGQLDRSDPMVAAVLALHAAEQAFLDEDYEQVLLNARQLPDTSLL